jgi:tetratricopeptide (TPR) repeat protein
MAKNRNAALDLAWEYYVQGFRLHWLMTPETNAEARQMFTRATKIRPDFARGYAHLSFTHLVAWLNGWDSPPGGRSAKVSMKKVREYADLAVDKGGDDYDNLWSLGLAQVYGSQLDDAIKTYERAIKNAKTQGAAPINIHAIRIDLADAYMFKGGEKNIDKAIDLARKALEASPTPQRWFTWTLGWCYYEAAFIKNDASYYELAHEALSGFKRPDTLAAKLLIAVKIALGRKEEAQRIAAGFMATLANQGYTLKLEERWPYPKDDANAARFQNYLGHLREAGFPEG